MGFCGGGAGRTGNLTINGMDALVIPDLRYHEALANELVRATKAGGIVFGVVAPFGYDALPQLPLLSCGRMRRPSVRFPHGDVFEKAT